MSFETLDTDPLRACGGKVRHATKGDAERGLSARHAGGRFSSKGARGRLHAYKCTFCGTWHVGGKPLK